MAVEALDRQLPPVEEDILAPDLHSAEAEALDQVVHRNAVQQQLRLGIVQGRCVDIPHLHVLAGDTDLQGGLLSRSEVHRQQCRFLSINTQPELSVDGMVAQAAQDRLHPCFPAVAHALGRDVQLLDVGIAQLLHRNRAGNAAV